jgi:RNA polymerase sigma-70 factor (ECF subfamily)
VATLAALGPGSMTDRRRWSHAATAADDELVRYLYETYSGRLLEYVTGLTRDQEWAEDIVQVTLIRAWRSRRKLPKKPTTLSSWLFAEVRQTYVNDCRARAARPVCLTGEQIRTPIQEDDIERVLSSVTISQALGALSDLHRQTLIEAFYRQRSVAEAAAALGISPGTVKSRVHYGLRRLRQVLLEQEADQLAA